MTLKNKSQIAKENTARLHREVMELESIIDSMGAAMRSAHTRYVAESGKLTPGIEWALERYKWYAMKVSGVRSFPCDTCGQTVLKKAQ